MKTPQQAMQQAVEDARAEGIAIGRRSGDLLVAEMRVKFDAAMTLPDCPACRAKRFSIIPVMDERPMTLDDALARIAALEREVARLQPTFKNMQDALLNVIRRIEDYGHDSLRA